MKHSYEIQQLASHIPALTGRTIVNYENLYFAGTIAGSEFVTYDVQKIYLCARLDIGGRGGVFTSNGGLISLYDPFNNIVMGNVNKTAIQDHGGTDYLYSYNDINISNRLFSRILVNTYSLMSFIGMRISLSP